LRESAEAAFTAIVRFGSVGCGFRDLRVLEVPVHRRPDGGRVLGSPEAAVVAPKRAIQVAIFAIEIVAQDHGAVAQIGTQVEQILVGCADLRHPERHDLHVAARGGAGERELLETALMVDDGEHKLRVRPERIAS
jgi:hypothetical protein